MGGEPFIPVNAMRESHVSRKESWRDELRGEFGAGRIQVRRSRNSIRGRRLFVSLSPPFSAKKDKYHCIRSERESNTCDVVAGSGGDSLGGGNTIKILERQY